MSDTIDVYKVMDYERELTEFLTSYAPEEEVRSYPIWKPLEETREMLDHYFRTETFEFTPGVRDVAYAGLLAQKGKDLEVVSPDGDKIDKEMSEVFAERMLKEENPWEALYEVEVAYQCENAGFNTKLINEGTTGGPDIYVEIDDTTIDIECKRRRAGNTGDPTYDEGFTTLKQKILDTINNGVDGGEIPELSFYLDLGGEEPLTEDIVDEVSEIAIDVLRNKQAEKEAVINGAIYTARLEDYFYGEKILEMDEDDLNTFTELPNERHISRFLSGFDTEDLDPGMYLEPRFMIDESKNVHGKGIQVINFNFPDIDEDYYSRVLEGVISRGRGDLSGRSPSALFVYIPSYEFIDMGRFVIDGYQEERIPQIERLEQRIRGQLNQSNSLNAIILNSTFVEFAGKGIQYSLGISSFNNEDPEKSLPDEFSEHFQLD
ncbi:hypothetical protein [Haladaptatus halobius]|uniref:hypothetical protein n=1 Tax=Haladaptatus halobius TaxID=2884875 RepID=UPI001D0A2C45|nr:hypothetical protein [Haladaptatus halobius]